MSGKLPTMKKYSLSPTSNSNECLDLSVKGLSIMVYFPRGVPGSEYEIISSNDLEGFREPLNIGSRIFSQQGNANLQGEVIALSEKRSNLALHFNSITSRHRRQLEERTKETPCITPNVGGRRVIKIAHTDTQTDDLTEEEWMRKCDELKSKIDMVQTALSVIGSNLEGDHNKLVTISDESYTSSPSNSFYSSDEETRSILTENTPTLASNNVNAESHLMVKIGSHGTVVPKHVFDTINWSSHTAATRKLLVTLFSREILATHSLTGKPSPAFLNSDKQLKIRLDPAVTSDIVEVVSQRCKVPESLVRYSITTKCADENKLYRLRQKRKKMPETDDEQMNEKKPNLRC